ncbi:MAG: ATP-binding protein [Chloroflexota bacterium]
MPRQARAQLLQEVTRVNPWWHAERWDQSDRHLGDVRRALFERHPATLDDVRPPNLYTLRGPRRVGKSTLLKQTVRRLIAEGIDPRRVCYFPADLLASNTDIVNLFQAARMLFPDVGDQPRYFLIDEATSIQDWQLGLKWLRDNTPVGQDCVVITGSSARDIAAGTVHLAGRRGPEAGLDRLLLPLSFGEFTRFAGVAVPNPPTLPFEAFYAAEGRAACQEALVHLGALVDAFEAYLLVGGFPQAVADFRRSGSVSPGFIRDLWDVLQSDLMAAGLTQPEQGLRLLERLAASLTGPIVLRELAEALGVAHTTAGAWLNALAQSYLLLLVFPESGGRPDTRRQRKAYPVDPLVIRVASHRLASDREVPLSQMAEAAIGTAIFRSLEEHQTDRFERPSRLFFYRTSSGGEVDFMVQPGRRAVESKYVDSPTTRESRAMVANFDGGLLLTRAAVDLDPRVTIIPASIFCWLLRQG